MHWLPVSRRIDFKILLITYKALNNLTPEYISSLLFPANRPSYLRSASDKSLLRIDKFNNKNVGGRAFSIYAPRIWNPLPIKLRESQSVDVFKNKLKTYLFELEFSCYL